MQSTGVEVNCFTSLFCINLLSTINSHNSEVCSMTTSESEPFPPVTMSPSKAHRLMPRIKISVWLVTVLVVVYCTPAKAHDTPVSCVIWLRRYWSHLLLRSLLLSDITCVMLLVELEWIQSLSIFVILVVTIIFRFVRSNRFQNCILICAFQSVPTVDWIPNPNLLMVMFQTCHERTSLSGSTLPVVW